MQTLEFTKALKEIVDKMRVGQIVSTLGKWLVSQPQGQNPNLSDQDKSEFSTLMFDSYAGYASLLGSESTRKILEGLDIKDFYEPNRLRILVASISSFSQIGQVRTLPEANMFFEKIRSLQTLTATSVNLLEKEKVGTLELSDGIVELELADYGGKGIEPERLKQLVITVTDLHTNLARIHGIEGDQLRFKYFDSGSALRVGIECAVAIALSMTTLLFQWWDKIRFSRYETFDKKIESASKGLTFMETVKQSVEKQVINEEWSGPRI